MDSLISAAARALMAGDPLGALKRVALRDDAPALALRGIAMAQLGDLVRAKALLRSAARAFGPREAVARARCVVAEAEVALASRDLGWPAKALDTARATLEEHGDRVNAAHARYLERIRISFFEHPLFCPPLQWETMGRGSLMGGHKRMDLGARTWYSHAPWHQQGSGSTKTPSSRS